MPGFRSLAEDEAVEFECVESEKGIEATYVTGPELANLKGSRFHLNNRKRFRKTRCVKSVIDCPFGCLIFV